VTQKIRSGFLMFAAMAMVLSSVGGCASSGAREWGAAPREIPHPSPENLLLIPEETPVRVELLSGKIVEGLFLSYSQAEASVQFRMKQIGNALSDEFNEEGRIYTIPEEKIVILHVLEPPNQSRTTGVIVGVGVVLFMAFLAWANAMAHATGN